MNVYAVLFDFWCISHDGVVDSFGELGDLPIEEDIVSRRMLLKVFKKFFFV